MTGALNSFVDDMMVKDIIEGEVVKDSDADCQSLCGRCRVRGKEKICDEMRIDAMQRLK